MLTINDYNPIQMGSSFTSFHESELEFEIRDMVDSLIRQYGYVVPVTSIDTELTHRNLIYNDLPQSCKDMIDELDVVM